MSGCNSLTCAVALIVTVAMVPVPAKAVDTIPFTDDKGLIKVQGAVDGGAPVPMLVNLGAGVDVLSTPIGRRYVVVGGKYVSLRLSGERVDLPVGTVQSLTMGGVRIDAPHVGIWSGLDGSGVDGFISATAFRDITVTFNFRENQIIIEDAQTFPERVRLAARAPAVLQDDLGIALGVFARFDFGGGRTGLCEIDTGSAGITLDKTFAASIGVVPASGGTAQLNSIALAGLPQSAIANPTVGVGNLIYDCDVGNAFWAGRSFTLDLPNHWIYVETSS